MAIIPSFDRLRARLVQNACQILASWNRTMRDLGVHLLIRRRFAPLFLTQALSVFGDHLFRNAVLFLIVYEISAASPDDASTFANLAMASFSIPYFLFSSLAGELADRVDKARLARWVAFGDVVIMMMAALALHTAMLPLLLTVLFLAGTRATMFGPLKYAVLPDHLKRGELVAGTGLMHASSSVAIVGGQTAGGLLDRSMVAQLLLSISIIAYLAALLIPKAPAKDPIPTLNLNIIRGSMDMIKVAMLDPTLRRAVLGLTWFYVLGAIFTSQFIPFTRNQLGFDETVATLLLVSFSFGVVSGSLAVGVLVRGEITTRLAAPAAALLGLFIIDLIVASAGATPLPQLMTLAHFVDRLWAWRILVDLFGIAAAAAVFAVPYQTILQTAGEPARRGRDLSANNIVNAVGVVLALLVAASLTSSGVAISGVFLVLGTLTIVISTAEWRASRASR